jgi:tRNA(adenine34) deaminase
MNPCPTLEACRLLGLDTRDVCPKYNEGATDALVRLIDPGLRYARNHGSLRPRAAYCEEMILLE